MDIIELLSYKITKEYSFNVQRYSDIKNDIDLILIAYNEATSLFNYKSSKSISIQTLKLYMKHINQVLNQFTQNMDNLEETTCLILDFIQIQYLTIETPEILFQKFSSELIKNKNYYKLFSMDYFLEKRRIYGIEATLNELENDVNIRAYTYFDVAYKEYLDILPGFDFLISLT